MCLFGGQPKVDMPAAPQPAPLPQPVDSNPIQTAETKRRKLRALQYGFASTIKTSPQGVAGQGADLMYQGGKNNLGG